MAHPACEQRENANAWLRLVLENAVEFAIISMDLTRKVTTWNRGAEHLLGHREREVLGTTADVVFTPEDRARGAPDEEAATSSSTGRAADERVHLRKDGSRFWGSGVLMLMRDPQGAAVGFVKIMRDETAVHESRQALERSEAELMRIAAENERARAELQAADVNKDRFLAVLSHELRNPLASIASAADLILAPGTRPEDTRDAAEVVRRQSRSMKTLLDDLLDVTRLKLGRFQLSPERVGLLAIVTGALETTRPLLAESGHGLTLDLPQGDIELDGDLLRLQQVVSNLLANATRYTPRGGKVALSAALRGDELEIVVRDNGVGMDPAQLDSMFEMFAQGQTASQRTQGLGIGLSLVRQIVELHGGRVTAHSDGPGRGSEFRICLPGARIGASPAPAAPGAPIALSAGLRGRVLVADDNVDAGWGIAKLLEIAGFRTVSARSGAEALAALQAGGFNAAVLDLGMPDMGGHEIARRARAAEWGRGLVLVAATGWGQASAQRDSMAAGFDAHMTKPVEARKLAALLDGLLASKRRA